MPYPRGKPRGRRPVRKVARKRPVYRKKKGVSALARKVNRMMYQMQPEKKQITYLVEDSVGQLDGNNVGALLIDITPTPSQGTAISQRIGQSIKLSGMFFQGQLIQQSATTDTGYIIIEVWKHKNKEVSISNSTLSEIYSVNPFSTTVDAASRRNQTYFSDYVCLRRQKVYVPQDHFGSMSRCKNWTMPIKFKNGHTIRFDNVNNVVNGQLLLVVRSASGNKSPTTATTISANVPFTAINTGWKYLHSVQNYYTDN